MAAEIGPGSMLECIRTATCPFSGVSVTVGSIYTCTDVVLHAGTPCALCLRCEGVELQEVSPDPLAVWCSCIFRPYRSGEMTSILERLSKPEPVLEPA